MPFLVVGSKGNSSGLSKINSKTINYEDIDIKSLISNIIEDVKSHSINQIA